MAAATLATTLLAAAFATTAGAAPVGTVVHQSAAGVLPPAELPSALSSTMPPTAAWILVDADTGEVVESQNDRTPLPPASLTKVITALAASNVAPSTPVTVSAQAAGEPLDDLGVHTGQVWSADDLFHAMLIYSANDAAMALAQQVAGSTASIQTVLSQTAQALGLQDHPLLYDPAGLDGSEGVAGGNRVSARDLAIAGRALLADPYLASIVALQTYNFRSPTGGQVRLVSHNLAFLSSYRGSIGIKTGYTNLAGTCVMAAARRGGRTMLAVVLHSANPTVAATTLLDDGFNTPVAGEPRADELPTVDLTALQPTAAIGVSAGGSSAETPAVAAPAGASPAAAAGPAIAGAGIAAAGAHQPKSFGMLTLDGILALLLPVAMVARRRSDPRRRAVAPNSSLVESPPLLAGSGTAALPDALLNPDSYPPGIDGEMRASSR
ncbi:MAG: D-alanyl-D-alanine carboxypeptidase family protein [Acidimicrobiales bacterium]